MTDRRILFEFTVLGDVARCAAVDAETGVEASSIAHVCLPGAMARAGKSRAQKCGFAEPALAEELTALDR